MNKGDKAELLNTLEQNILIVAGDIRVTRQLGGDPRGFLADDENRLGDMLNAVLALKKLEGIPSAIKSIVTVDAEETE